MPLSKTTVNNFSSIKIQELVQTFNLEPGGSHPGLIKEMPLTDEQNVFIKKIISFVSTKIEYWNEQELIIKYISRILNSIGFYGNGYDNFAERVITAKINNYTLTGVADFLVAKGIYEPETPYFFIQEFKKAKNPTGDPLAQLLGEMLVARELNKNKVVHGVYIVGRFWYFIVLDGSRYFEEFPLDSVKEADLITIISKLNWVKSYVEEMVAKG